LRRERASVRASLLVPGARLAADLDTGLDAVLEAGLADDFAAGLPLPTCPLRRLRAASGLALLAPLAPFA
jgi:hypothetical protein